MPLFVEEMTKAVVEAETKVKRGRPLCGPCPALAVPATLRASLMARLDRLGPPRRSRRSGRRSGASSPTSCLAAVRWPSRKLVLQDALDPAQGSRIDLPAAAPHLTASYIFKHALVQDAAYATMLRGRRQQIHAPIASVLEKRFSELVNSTPEVIAQQFERAGQNEKSIQYWRQAGDRDLRRFAMKGIDRALFRRATSRRGHLRKRPSDPA